MSYKALVTRKHADAYCKQVMVGIEGRPSLGKYPVFRIYCRHRFLCGGPTAPHAWKTAARKLGLAPKLR